MFTVPKSIPPFKVPGLVDTRQAAQRGAPGTATPQEKILSVAHDLGIEGMEVMQATTRTLWDALPLDGRTTFDFFRQCNLRAWPLTNLSQNKLEVGEAFIVEWLTIAIGDFVAAVPPVNAFYRITGGLASFANSSYVLSDISMNVANEQVMKPLSLAPVMSVLNKDSNFQDHEPSSLFTLLSIPSLQEFFFQWRIQDNSVIADNYAFLFVTGTAIQYRSPSAL